MSVPQVSDWSTGHDISTAGWSLGLYQPSPETKGYWDGVAKGKLLLKWDPQTREYFHPRRIANPGTGSFDLEWKPASGRGSVYSFSTIHRAPTPKLQKSTPYTVGLVELEEGVIMFTRFFSEKEIRIGAQATVEFRRLEAGVLLPVFILS